jgi:hypothetical protein
MDILEKEINHNLGRPGPHEILSNFSEQHGFKNL